MSAPGIINKVPDVAAFNNLGGIPNVRTYFASATTAGGVATVYATSDGTATGTAIFSQILYANASPWVNTSSATAAPMTSGKSISSDQRTLTFNVTSGTSLALGGATMVAAPNGTQVLCMIWGIP